MHESKFAQENSKVNRLTFHVSLTILFISVFYGFLCGLNGFLEVCFVGNVLPEH